MITFEKYYIYKYFLHLLNILGLYILKNKIIVNSVF